MSIIWIDVMRWVAMLGIFFGMFYLLLKYSLRFFEGVEVFRRVGTDVNPEVKRKSWFVTVLISNLVGLELVLGALAIWTIWSGLPGTCFAILVAVFIVLQIGRSMVEHRGRSLATKDDGKPS